MARLVFAPHALQDVERLTAFLIESDPDAAAATAQLLFGGLRILKEHPLVGRPAEHGYRELLISRGRTGYVALYRFDVERDVAIVLAVRHQREGGFDG
ncbi:type II toxin-antitoxin system RelE/ParE family toxin [Thiobacillus sedimenti]|uniref:Type II toxin-antitoxin system RelE/ParE family toxin n=1 Tax=Thiobacillus sedimenti TaxID=3110231 RepID=A0ABZ1CGH4_9PROT|nr:type II toxin-antitoxin system RelE/ParE family toxin [Thiobacillus sp. SCUT-2]WRS38484.1 type II toxin-antitoxin system RelE/ParE family toxin [Thiobacillus sp. SCUT-2]